MPHFTGHKVVCRPQKANFLATSPPMFTVGRLRGTWDFVSPSRHAGTDGLAYGNALGIKVVQAEDIDPEVVGRHALAVKGVNPADLAEEVPRCLGMELVFRERIFAREQAKLV